MIVQSSRQRGAWWLRISKASTASDAKLAGFLPLGVLFQVASSAKSTLQCLATVTMTSARRARIGGETRRPSHLSLTGEGLEARTGAQVGRARTTDLTRAMVEGALPLAIAAGPRDMTPLGLSTVLGVTAPWIEMAGGTIILEKEATGRTRDPPNAAEVARPLAHLPPSKPHEASRLDP